MLEFALPPLVLLGLGVLTVLGGIIVLRLNAFLAMLAAALLVSLLAPGPLQDRVGRVAEAFGNTAGGVGIVIALAAIIGKCMMDSGAADSVVRMFLRLFGEKRSGLAMMGSGFALSVPVFFDTVFYLLVPLARSLYRRTGRSYLKAVTAIAAGGAITHTLVPPTPGPLLIASNLGIDLGLMILVGLAVALPAGIMGLAYAAFCDAVFKIPVRDVDGTAAAEPIPDQKLPSLPLSLVPVVLPVLLISVHSVLETVANNQRAAQLQPNDVNLPALGQILLDDESNTPLNAIDAENAEGAELASAPPEVPLSPPLAILKRLPEADQEQLRDLAHVDEADVDDDVRQQLVGSLNRNILQDRKTLPGLARANAAVVEHVNREALEEALPDAVAAHTWETPIRRLTYITAVPGNPNLALFLSAIVAMLTLVAVRKPSREELAKTVESALMSGGVIILITSAGGAFGAMLTAANIGSVIEGYFRPESGEGAALPAEVAGLGWLLLGFGVASLFKVAQGSSTVAMIAASGIMAALLQDAGPLGYNTVYLATAVGAGSLFGSWMNDSGFWIFAKMGGLTEVESLKTWTVTLAILALTGLAGSVTGALLVPLASTSP